MLEPPIAVIVTCHGSAAKLFSYKKSVTRFFSCVRARMHIRTIPKKWSGPGRPCRPVCDDLASM